MQAAIFLANPKSSTGNTGRMMPASCTCGWVGQRKVSVLHRPGTLLYQRQLLWCLSLGNLNENVIETASDLSGSQWRTSPFRTSQKGGMGWSKEAQITKMFFLALVVLLLMSIKCSCWPGYSWLKPPADCLTDVLFLWYQMQAFHFWLMCTSPLFYFYQVFSTPDVAAPAAAAARRARGSLTAAAAGPCCSGSAPRGLIPASATACIHPSLEPAAWGVRLLAEASEWLSVMQRCCRGRV